MQAAPSIIHKPVVWQSLLVGQLRVEAEQAVREIAAALAAPTMYVPAEEVAHRALFFGYLAAAWGEAEYAERAYACLNEAIDRAPSEFWHYYLYGGYAGLGWVTAQLTDKARAPSALENCASVDDALIEMLRTATEPLRYELLFGLAGLGVYALERWRQSMGQPAAVEMLRLILARLAATAERTTAGLTWLTPANQLPSWQRQLCPNGHYNLGLAHGVPGLLPMLARACAIPETRVQAWELLVGAGRWLAAQQQRDTTGSWFPHWLAAELEPEPGWVAWCYGSLGAATAWLDAARRTGQRDWERAALAMLRRVAQIPVAEASVRSDAALCHGAAGNAHIFNRLYQATGETVFQVAALRWYAHTLALRVPGTGLAGFQRWMPSESGEPAWTPSPGFLDGVAGIGLALLAACTNDEPQWDCLLAVALG